MAAAMDNLDEFFDFARLEHDHGHDPLDTACQQQPAFLLPHDVAVMDWAAPDLMTICPADTLLPHDVYMPDAFETPETSGHVQPWPLVDAVGPLAPLGACAAASSAFPTWHIGTADTQHPLLDQKPHSVFTPSSSSPRSQQLELTSGHDEPGSEGVFELPQQESTSALLDQVILDSSISPASTESAEISTRPHAPFRQASVASWKPASAKRKGPQSRIPFEARQILEDEFAANPYPCSWEMDIIAHQANLDVKKVRNWFNNTRARKKGEGKPLIVGSL